MILAICSPSRSTNDTASSAGIDPDLPTPVRHGIALTQLIETISANTCQNRRLLRHCRGHDDSRPIPCRPRPRRGVHPRHRRPDHRGRSATSRVHRRDHPVVLGGKGQPLDVGRRRRLHSETMRLAMGVRDGGCTTEGCETPPGLCHAHHDTPWSHGGHTSVEDGRLLCPHHHRRIHDPQLRDPTSPRR